MEDNMFGGGGGGGDWYDPAQDMYQGGPAQQPGMDNGGMGGGGNMFEQNNFDPFQYQNQQQMTGAGGPYINQGEQNNSPWNAQNDPYYNEYSGVKTFDDATNRLDSKNWEWGVAGPNNDPRGYMHFGQDYNAALQNAYTANSGFTGRVFNVDGNYVTGFTDAKRLPPLQQQGGMITGNQSSFMQQSQDPMRGMMRDANGNGIVQPGQPGAMLPMNQQQNNTNWFDRGGVWGEGTAGPEGAPSFVTNPKNDQDWRDRYFYFMRQQEGSYQTGEEMLMRNQRGEPIGVRNDIRQQIMAQQAMRNQLPQPGMGNMAQWAQGMRFNPNTPLARLATQRPAPRPAPRPVYNNRPSGGGGGAPRPAQSAPAPQQNKLPAPGSLLSRTDNTGRTEVGAVNAARDGVYATGGDMGLSGITNNAARYYAGAPKVQEQTTDYYRALAEKQRQEAAAQAAQRVIGSLFGAISQSAGGNSQTR